MHGELQLDQTHPTERQALRTQLELPVQEFPDTVEGVERQIKQQLFTVFDQEKKKLQSGWARAGQAGMEFNQAFISQFTGVSSEIAGVFTVIDQHYTQVKSLRETEVFSAGEISVVQDKVDSWEEKKVRVLSEFMHDLRNVVTSLKRVSNLIEKQPTRPDILTPQKVLGMMQGALSDLFIAFQGFNRETLERKPADEYVQTVTEYLAQFNAAQSLESHPVGVQVQIDIDPLADLDTASTRLDIPTLVLWIGNLRENSRKAFQKNVAQLASAEQPTNHLGEAVLTFKVLPDRVILRWQDEAGGFPVSESDSTQGHSLIDGQVLTLYTIQADKTAWAGVTPQPGTGLGLSGMKEKVLRQGGVPAEYLRDGYDFPPPLIQAGTINSPDGKKLGLVEIELPTFVPRRTVKPNQLLN